MGNKPTGPKLTQDTLDFLVSQTQFDEEMIEVNVGMLGCKFKTRMIITYNYNTLYEIRYTLHMNHKHHSYKSYS